VTAADTMPRYQTWDASLPLADSFEAILGRALEVLEPMIPFDLATIMLLEGEMLRVRIARGRLAKPAVKGHRIALADYPTIQRILQEGHAHAFLEHDHAHGDGDPFDGVLDLEHGHSCMVVPLCLGTRPIGVMTFDKDVCRPYDSATTQLAEVYGQLLAIGLVYADHSDSLQQICSRLEQSNSLMAQGYDVSTKACDMVESCPSAAMRQVATLARQVAETTTPVLLTGETGTGKGVMARAIHEWSDRAKGPLVVVNCAALPRDLLESELFGHVAGAFTGARGARTGRFQAADKGTIFLDEIGEIPFELQAKLLRILQEGCFEAVGSSKTVHVDVRIIAATNLDLSKAMAESRFRDDLYYRLAVFPIHIPALRDRREDIPVIAKSFLASLSRKSGRGPWRITDEQVRRLTDYGWPGNIRELINTLERATILSSGSELDLNLLPELTEACARGPADHDDDGSFATLIEMEREHIRRAVERCDGQIHGKGGAAELLAINPNTLRSRMHKLGLLTRRNRPRSR